MLKSFRFWCLAAGAFSILTSALHVIGGGPEFHGPALQSTLPDQWKAAFSTIWHGVTAILFLNGAFLIFAALALRKNTLLLWLELLVNFCIAALFFGYGLVRLGTVLELPQWLAFLAISTSVGLALYRNDNLRCVEEVAAPKAHFAALPAASFADTYVIHGTEFSSAIEAARGAFGRAPKWISKLMQLRNALVKPFGLVHETPPSSLNRVGMFPILQSSESQVILGLNDKHLDFRIVVELAASSQTLLMTTLVQPHHIFGKAYLAIILPFHRIIAATVLAQAGKA